MAKIALIRPGSIGDIIMTFNSIPPLKLGNDVTYFCNSRLLDVLRNFANKNDIVEMKSLEEHDPKEFDANINLIGYPLGEGYPNKKMGKHLVEYFAKEIGVDFSFENLNLDLPRFPKKIKNRDYPRYVTFQNKTGWSAYKDWWGWQQLIDIMKERIPNVEVYQIGGPEDPQIANTDGSFCGDPFEDNLAAQAWANLHLGLDSVFNHTTNIRWRTKGRTKGVILFGSTQADASGYPHNTNISLGLPCQPCFKEDPKMSRVPLGLCDNPPNQTYEKPQHACMKGITPEMVFEKIKL